MLVITPLVEENPRFYQVPSKLAITSFTEFPSTTVSGAAVASLAACFIDSFAHEVYVSLSLERIEMYALVFIGGCMFITVQYKCPWLLTLHGFVGGN